MRQALARAIDRRRLLDTLWRGQGRLTEIAAAAGQLGRTTRTSSRSPTTRPRPRGLLDAAGFPDPDGDGPLPRFTLVYKTSTDDTRLLQAQVIQAMLAAVGIRVEIRSYEFATFYSDVKQGSFQLYSLTWTAVADPDLYRYVLTSSAIPPDGANRNRYRNPEFDRLVEEAGRLFDPDLRRPLYWRAQEILRRDLPYLSLLTMDTISVLAAGLEGYQSYPSGELTSIAHMRWHRASASETPGAGR